MKPDSGGSTMLGDAHSPGNPVFLFQIVREYTYAYAAVCPFDGDLDALILPDVHAQSLPFVPSGTLTKSCL